MFRSTKDFDLKAYCALIFAGLHEYSHQEIFKALLEYSRTEKGYLPSIARLIEIIAEQRLAAIDQEKATYEWLEKKLLRDGCLPYHELRIFNAYRKKHGLPELLERPLMDYDQAKKYFDAMLTNVDSCDFDVAQEGN